MHFPTLQSVALLVLAGANAVLAAPAPAPADADASTSGSGSCSPSQLLVRKEWRKLSKSDRLSFISAVKCLMHKPPKTSGIYQGVRTRFDDFQALHIASTDHIHFNGPFLAWHRWLLHLYELELRSTCGYKGALPYWDFSLDNTVESFPKSPLFDPTYGFGGNGPYIADVSDPILFPVKTPTIIPGRTGGGCVDNGPFKNLTVPMGVGNSTAYNPHCLRRDFSPTFVSTTMSDANIKAAKDAKTFWDFSIRIQGTSFEVSGLYLHAGMHLGIGGQVGEAADTYSSPGDPLFYFIHSALDKVWNDWQRAKWSTRKAEVAGPDTNFAYPFNFFGDIPYKNITLDYSMAFPNFGSNVKIREVMDIQASNLCYTYA